MTDSEDDKKMKAEALDNSAVFDVHRWSDYKEVNAAVDVIYDEMKSDPSYGAGKSKLRKKHIKPIILDLYVKWLTDPSMYTAIHRRKEHYTKVDDRYNKLHIKYDNTINTMDFLIDHDYAEYAAGTFNRDGKHKSRISRLRATSKLIDYIVDDFHVLPHMAEKAPNTECIILRDLDEDKKKQVEIPYKDTPNTEKMRGDLYKYNNLLRRTFIDIPNYPPDGIPTKSSRKKKKGKKWRPKKIYINQHDKYVRRIFNNNSWYEGGRYYGGWWQRIPEEWRAKILIWNTPVTEIDYSGLHIIILYAVEGIDYWADIGKDPYLIKGLEESERMRDLLKQVLLTAINAKSRKAAIKGVRWTINTDMDQYGWVYDEKHDLDDLIARFEKAHMKIKDYFFSRKGTKLQNIDANIATKVVNHFTNKEIPVLCIHDSFVISTDQAKELNDVMDTCLKEVIADLGLKVAKGKQKFSGMDIGKWKVLMSHPDYRDEMIDNLIKAPYDYPEWKQRMDDFRKVEREKDYYKS